MEKIEERKYYKYDKIYLYKVVGSGKYTSYSEVISEADMLLYRYAASLNFMARKNDAPRGGKLGEHYEVLKYFSHSNLLNKMYAEKRRLEKRLKTVLKSEKIDEFTTESDVGNIVINGVSYRNYYGDARNRIEVCKCDRAEFNSAKYITRRQIFNEKAPINIVKLNEPTTLEVSIYDCNDSMGSKLVENAIGFVIWECKCKIFTI